MSVALKTAKMSQRTGRMGPSRGDPGLFGAIGGAIKGFVTGGPTGAIAGAVSGFRSRPGAPPPLRAPTSGRVTVPVAPVPGVSGFAQRALPFGKTGFQVSVPSNGANGDGGCRKGFRPNKSDYFLRDGTFVPAGTRCVKLRRRNPMNPRALDRAIGRIDSAKRIQRKLSEITTAKHTAAGNARTC